MVAALLLVISAPEGRCQAADPGPLKAGFAVVDITPKLEAGKPIWLAGKELNRAATGVHDPLYVRAVSLDDGQRKVALVSVDSIGLPRPSIVRAREGLKDFHHVLVASTHSHESPDVIGIWGPSQGISGVVPQYVQLVEAKIVEAVRQAEATAVPAKAEYATAEDETLLGDFRLPEVYDGVLRLLRFRRADNGQPLGLVVQWNSHGIEPDKNSLVSRDYMGSTVDALEKRHACPVLFFQGAIGGLMGTPAKLVAEAKAGNISGGIFGFIDACGAAIADLADRALQQSEPIALTPLAAYSRPILIPLDNPGYRAAMAAGVLDRDVFPWTGKREQRGEKIPRGQVDGPLAMETEVGYLRLGELHLAAIPGELYPELVYGKFQEPADPGADFVDAPLEKPVAQILPGKKFLLIGLANDEVGYIIPKRQWDVVEPYAYGRKSAQYGERNSVGPDTARMLIEALEDRVQQAAGP
jgi:hypothetical protein